MKKLKYEKPQIKIRYFNNKGIMTESVTQPSIEGGDG